MNKSPQSTRFWRIMGPILGYIGIQFVAQFVAQTIIMMMHLEEVLTLMGDINPENYMSMVTQMSVKFTEYILQYQNQIASFVAICTLPMTVLLFRKDRRMEKAAQLPVNKKAPLFQYGWILMFGVFLCIGVNVLFAASGLAMKDVSYMQASSVVYAENIVLLLVCQGIIIPIGEEMMFRGVLFRRCREQMKFWGAAFFVACLFAFIHGSVIQVTYTLVLGLFLAYVYEKYGSLKAAVFLHMVVNIISVLVTKLGLLVWICSDFTRIAVAIIGCAFAGAIAFVKIQGIHEKPELPEITVEE